jgi:hypothetical protein
MDNIEQARLAMKRKRANTSSTPLERRILTIRGEKVILDVDLAELYGVATKRLNEQVKRNAGRFPPDFAFLLTDLEKAEVVANCDHLLRRALNPCVLWRAKVPGGGGWLFSEAPKATLASPFIPTRTTSGTAEVCYSFALPIHRGVMIEKDTCR